MDTSNDQYRKFAKITFDDFRKMAADESLSTHEKIGGPDSYLEGKGEVIFQNVVANLPHLNDPKKTVLDIGPGCGDLPRLMIDHCLKMGHTLLLVDSSEMLTHLPDGNSISKIPAYFPQCEQIFRDYSSKVDVILAYSVLHYVFVEGNIWDFLDRSLELLAENGQMLIGDIPNLSKRRRFFSSTNGVQFHQRFMNTTELPEVHFNTIDRHKIDDSVVLGMLNRARNQGFDAYVVPQPPGLPMANRREDILIRRP
jgi:Cyclopropane fatty acid synthase and related methyltransferases